MIGTGYKYYSCLAALLLVLTGSVAFSLEEAPKWPFNLYHANIPSINTTYKNSENSGKKVDWVREAIWIWTPSYEYNLIATPTLRLLFETPFDFSVLALDVDVRLVNEEIENANKTFIKKTLIDIPFYYKKTVLKVRLKDGSTAEIHFFLIPFKNENLVLIHESCLQLGLSFKTIRHETKEDLTNLALTCLKEGPNLFINIQHQIGWQTSVKDNLERLRVGKFRGILKIDLEGMELPKDNIVGAFHMINKNKKSILEYEIETDGRMFPKFQFKAGGGLHLMHYNESQTNTQLDSLLLKIFLAGTYDFRTSPYLIGGGISFSPISVYSSQGDQKRATFVDFDASFARKFLQENRTWFSLGVGAFYWGMQVNVAGWGVDYLTGPRIVFSFNKDNPKDRELIITAKFSPIYAESTIRFDSIIFDLETFYELTPSSSTAPLYLYNLLQHLRFSSRAQNRMVTSTAVSLGLAVSF